MWVIRLFDYISWSEQQVERTIREKLGWEKSDEVESSWRCDCRLDYVRRKMYASTVGVTELRDLLSKMIREGLITRTAAIARMEKEDHVDLRVVQDILRGLDLPPEQLCIGDER